MKAKIAKQEGDYRNAKKLNESLDRQIRMLERVIKQERAKNKAIVAEEKHSAEGDLKKKWAEKTGVPRTFKDNCATWIYPTTTNFKKSQSQKRRTLPIPMLTRKSIQVLIRRNIKITRITFVKRTSRN